MRAYIRKLQSKSEDARKQILVGSLVVSMAFVVFVWVYGLNDRFGTPAVAQASEEKTQSPFALFKDSIANAYSNITASVGNAPMIKGKEATNQKQIDLIPVEHSEIQ